MEQNALKLTSSAELPKAEPESHNSFIDDVWSNRKELVVGGALAAGALAAYGAWHGNFAPISELGGLLGKAGATAAEDTTTALSKSAANGVQFIDLGGGIDKADLARYYEQLGLKAPEIKTVSIDGAKLRPDLEEVELWPIHHEDIGIVKFGDQAPKPFELKIDWNPPGVSMSQGMTREWTAEERERMNKVMRAAAERGVAIFNEQANLKGISVIEATK